MTTSFATQIKVAGELEWHNNAIRFATAEAAQAYGDMLLLNWSAATDAQVVATDDPVNLWTIKSKASTISRLMQCLR